MRSDVRGANAYQTLLYGCVACSLLLCAVEPAHSESTELHRVKRELESLRVELDEEHLKQVLDVGSETSSRQLCEHISQWYVPYKRGEIHGYALKFSNEEIVDQIVDAYIKIAKLEQKGGEVSDVDYDSVYACVGGGEEEALEFFDLFSDMAESTLSVELYPYIWDFPHPSSFRQLFLTFVRPDATIDRFVSSELGRSLGARRIGQDILYSEGTKPGTPLISAFQALSNIVSTHPNLATEKRVALIQFIANYALHFTPRSNESYVAWRDYLVRESAMEILSTIGLPEDLHLLDRIQDEAPSLSPSRRVRHPRDLAAWAQEVRSIIALGK